jgi:hypothetical protein
MTTRISNHRPIQLKVPDLESIALINFFGTQVEHSLEIVYWDKLPAMAFGNS